MGILGCLVASEARSTAPLRERIADLLEHLSAVENAVEPLEFELLSEHIDWLKKKVHVIELSPEVCGQKLENTKRTNGLGDELDYSYPVHSFLNCGVVSYLIFYDLSHNLTRPNTGELMPRYQVFYSLDAQNYGSLSSTDANLIYRRLSIFEQYSSPNDDPHRNRGPFVQVPSEDYLKQIVPVFAKHRLILTMPGMTTSD